MDFDFRLVMEDDDYCINILASPYPTGKIYKDPRILTSGEAICVTFTHSLDIDKIDHHYLVDDVLILSQLIEQLTREGFIVKDAIVIPWEEFRQYNELETLGSSGNDLT
jgi:hypothetical protein